MIFSSRFWGTLVISALLPCFSAAAQGLADGDRYAKRLQNPLGGGIQYQGLSSSESQVRSFTIPVVLPLEANLGRLNLGSSLEYKRQEIRTADDTNIQEGPSYISLDSRFRAFRSNRFKLEILESLNVPIARNTEETVPRELQFNAGGYVLDSGVSFSYFLRRATLKLGVEHNLRLARDDFNPGESVSAEVSLAYGFGGYGDYQDRRPFNLLIGFTSRYHYADRLNREEIQGTEFGTVFLAPGLQYYGSSLSLWATVEVPIHRTKIEEDGYQDKVRGNIGVKYYFR